MTLFKGKRVTIEELKSMDIANENGVIDYPKFREYKKKQFEKGYNVYLGYKEHERVTSIDLIDNESTVFNGKIFKAKNVVID